MEQNLTRYLEVVSASTAGLAPSPGHDLVVFKRAQAGHVFDRVVPNGQTIEQKKWISRLFTNSDELTCYAVNRDPHLVHTFSSQIDHTSHGHNFRLDYTIIFAVNNPRIIVERLNDDPIRKLETVVAASIDAEARKIPWEGLSHNVLQSAGEELTNSIMQRRLKELQEFAKEYGVSVQSITLAWHLGAEDIADIQAEIKGEKSKRLAEIGADTAEVELESQHKIDLIKARHDAELSAIRRREKLYDVGLENTAVAAKQVAEKINTVEGLRHVYEVVRETAIDHGQRQGLPGYRVGALPGAATQVVQPGIRLVIDEALNRCQGVSLSAFEQRDLIASVLHVIAGCYGDSDAKRGRLDEYIRTARELLLKTTLSSEQLAYFNRIFDLENLCDKLRD